MSVAILSRRTTTSTRTTPARTRTESSHAPIRRPAVLGCLRRWAAVTAASADRAGGAAGRSAPRAGAAPVRIAPTSAASSARTAPRSIAGGRLLQHERDGGDARDRQFRHCPVELGQHLLGRRVRRAAVPGGTGDGRQHRGDAGRVGPPTVSRSARRPGRGGARPVRPHGPRPRSTVTWHPDPRRPAPVVSRVRQHAGAELEGLRRRDPGQGQQPAQRHAVGADRRRARSPAAPTSGRAGREGRARGVARRRAQ